MKDKNVIYTMQLFDK